MMRQYWLFLIFSFICIGLNAQCPIGVSLSSSPDVSVSPVCKSTLVHLTATPSAGAIGNVIQYVWVVGNDTLSGNSDTTNILANNQNVVVYMQTTSGCTQDTVQTVLPIETVIIESTATPSIECNQTEADVQVVTTGNGLSPYTYELVGFETNNSGFYNAVPQGSYSVYVTDSQACKDTIDFSIISTECDPPIPSEIITPNGDGFNDTWQIANIQFHPNNEVFIHDRWGQRVYHKTGYDNADGWDAKYIGVDLPVSTYYYLLEIKPENGGDDIIMRGPISIFR